MSPRVLTNTVQHHKDSPSVTLEEHLRSKMVELGEAVMAKKRLYLDMRFWILLRDAELGRSDNARELLQLIRQKVAAELLICPIEQSVLFELMKQTDPNTRSATAELIDELSLGVTLVVQERRVRQELGGMIYSGQGIDHYPAHDLVWTKVTQILGEMIPRETVFDQENELLIQKGFLDEIWEHSFAELVDSINLNDWGDDYAPATAEQMRKDFVKYSREAKSFKVTYESEFMGYLELFADNAVDYTIRGYVHAGGSIDDVSEASRQESRKRFLDMIYGGLKEKPRKIATLLPTVHIGAICHAAVRMDARKKMTGNDLYDFYHATAAIPYCDAFFTEKPLHALLRQKRFNICEEFSCEIESTMGGAKTWVQQIN